MATVLRLYRRPPQARSGIRTRYAFCRNEQHSPADRAALPSSGNTANSIAGWRLPWRFAADATPSTRSLRSRDFDKK
ncbi:unnamed protein product, partial [Nesidiocoris tenuis]